MTKESAESLKAKSRTVGCRHLESTVTMSAKPFQLTIQFAYHAQLSQFETPQGLEPLSLDSVYSDQSIRLSSDRTILALIRNLVRVAQAGIMQKLDFLTRRGSQVEEPPSGYHSESSVSSKSRAVYEQRIAELERAAAKNRKISKSDTLNSRDFMSLSAIKRKEDAERNQELRKLLQQAQELDLAFLVDATGSMAVRICSKPSTCLMDFRLCRLICAVWVCRKRLWR